MLRTCFVVHYAYFNVIFNVPSLYNIVNDKNMYVMLLYIYLIINVYVIFIIATPN